MQLWKIVLVIILGLACGVAFVAALGFVYKKTVPVGNFSYKYQNVQVTVVDAETGEPIPKTEVYVEYHGEHYFARPEPDSAVTDDKGIASLKIAQGTTDWGVFYRSKEYLKSGRHSVSGIGRTKPPDQIEFKLDKVPEITLTVPAGYVGPIIFNLLKRPAG